MNKPVRGCGIVALAAIGAGAPAIAGPISINDFSGSETLLTFDGFPGGNNVSYGGVTITDNNNLGFSSADWTSYFDNIAGGSWGQAMYDFVGNTNTTIDFPGGTGRVGLLLSTTPTTTWQLDIYDPSLAYLGSTQGTMPADSEAVFIGWEDNAGIGRIVITEPNGDQGHISLFDDLRYEPIPAPSAVALLGLGGIVAGRRRR